MLSEKLIYFYQSLRPPKNLPKGIGVLFPQKDKQVIELVKKFFEKYFNDNNQRRLMLGINPGRYGAGIHPARHSGRARIAGTGERSDQSQAHSESSPRTGAGVLQSNRRALRSGLRTGPILAGVRAVAAADPPAAHRGRSRGRRGVAERTAGAPLQKSDCRG